MSTFLIWLVQLSAFTLPIPAHLDPISFQIHCHYLPIFAEFGFRLPQLPSVLSPPILHYLASCQQAILLENMETPGFIPSEPETLTGSNSTESLNGLDDGPIKFQDDPALDIDIKDVTNDLDEMLREVGRLNKAQSQTMINLNKDLETMISEASDVNRKNQKLLNKNKNKGEEEEVEEKEEGISGMSRKSLSSMFKKKKERPVSILL